jgi:hypothetical protein
MEAASTSETLVTFYWTTKCYNPEDSHLHTRRRENVKYYLAWWQFTDVSEVIAASVIRAITLIMEQQALKCR